MTTTDKATAYRLPARFYWDHVDRDLPAGRVLGETTRTVTVALTADEVDELASDARYYSTEWREMGPEFQGLGRSALATLKALGREVKGGQ